MFFVGQGIQRHRGGWHSQFSVMAVIQAFCFSGHGSRGNKAVSGKLGAQSSTRRLGYLRRHRLCKLCVYAMGLETWWLAGLSGPVIVAICWEPRTP